MSYIPRTLESEILELFDGHAPRGLILAGIVGCGKTTLVGHVLEALSERYAVVTFTSDDVQFRRMMIEDSTALLQHVRSRTTRPALVFIDEVQKCDEVFDAIKVAFDQGRISFIVSGSNPAYLATIARKRLQRRAHVLTLQPFSLHELLSHARLVPALEYDRIVGLFTGKGFGWIDTLPAFSVNEAIRTTVDRYGQFGGLPLVWLARGEKAKLREVQTIAERGFSPMSEDADAFFDIARVAIAQLNSREFTYDTLFQRTRTTKRHRVNAVIDMLMNHGYVFKKTPLLFHSSRTSYLFVLAWADPGIVHYFSGASPWEEDRGFTVESIVHAALVRIAGTVPKKSAIHYYKPYSIDANDKVKYRPGEIDFLFQIGPTITPVEVKAGSDIRSIDTAHLRTLMQERGMKYGIICYGGAPFVDKKARIVYWPYWWM